ncbi:MAG TPA: hypothetical protein VJB35_03725 [Candidatus Nanoarchaeia archaeon]|nr:hypothetical protein [Candidatus Nanoarchaeia archaeon]
MELKKLVIFSVSLIYLIFSFGLISSDMCSVQTSCNPDNTVFKMFSQSNSHAERYDQTNFNYYLCCDFTYPNPHTNSDGRQNKVASLSSITNAHVQAPEQTSYTNNVFFGDLNCVSSSGSCSSTYPIQMFSLSGATNAHVGTFNEYNLKVCCKQARPCGDGILQTPNSYLINEICDDGALNGVYSDIAPFNCNKYCNGTGPHPGDCVIDIPYEECDDCNRKPDDGCDPDGELETAAFWVNSEGQRIGTFNSTDIPAHIGETVQLILNNTGRNLTGSYSFDIFEDDLVFDDEIRTGINAIPGTFSSAGWGRIIGEWTITEQDYSITEIGDYDGFYFTVEGYESPKLRILPSDVTPWCSNYEDESSCKDCNYIGCDAAENSVNEKVFEAFPEVWNDTRCGDEVAGPDPSCTYLMLCKCVWNSSISKCDYTWSSSPGLDCDTDSSIPTVGSCKYSESTVDTCDDGFLEYSWSTAWTWGADNGYATYSNGPSDEVTDYVLENGLYYYDPFKLSQRCIGGSNIIPCPAEIQLPFFGFSNLIITIFLIVGIYSLIYLRRN